MNRPEQSRTVTIVRPPGRWPTFAFAEAWRLRRILLVLAQRLLLVRYRQAVLGFAWIIIQPLVLTIIMSTLLGLVLGRSERYGVPFPLFIFSAWMSWRVFTRIIGDGAASITRNGTLLQRIYLPRMFFPLSSALATLVDWLAMVVALLVLMLVYGYTPNVGVLALPALLAIMYACGLGVAFFFAASSLRYKDMEFVLPLVTQAWFWLSPIFYTSEVVPEQWRNLYYMNPMVVVIEGTRWGFLGTPRPPLEAWLLGGSVAGLVLVAGFYYFKKREPLFADLL